MISLSKNKNLVDGDFNLILSNDLDKLNWSPHKSQLARQENLNYMKILDFVDAYGELLPNVKKFTKFQLNLLNDIAD